MRVYGWRKLEKEIISSEILRQTEITRSIKTFLLRELRISEGNQNYDFPAKPELCLRNRETN